MTREDSHLPSHPPHNARSLPQSSFPCNTRSGTPTEEVHGKDKIVERIWKNSHALRCGLHEGRVETELRAVEEGGEFRQAKRQALSRSGAKADVAELPAGQGDFSVKVQVCVGER